MANDKKGPSYNVDFSWVQGETISPTKLTAWNKQISNCFATIEKALGDVWDESYPYFSSTDTLSAPIQSLSGSDLGSERKLEIANLARLVGPSSALNPIHLSELTGSELSVTETIPNSSTSNYYLLKYTPDLSLSLTFSGTSSVFTTRITNLTSGLTAAGDYYISDKGEIYTYSNMAGGTITYFVAMSTYREQTADYPRSTFNVIPDPSQSTKCSLAGPDGNGYYTLTLPTIENQVSNELSTATALTVSDLNAGAQLTLPTVLNHLSAGDAIPNGFLFIRDDTTSQLYRSASYLYLNSTSLQVGEVNLDVTHGFSIITIGSSITESIHDLKTKLWRHRRGRDGVACVNSTDIVFRTGKVITSGEIYSPSGLRFNQFPQYLLRDGFLASDDTGINDQNGMRGDLVLLASTRVGLSRNHTVSDSQKIRFGSSSTGPSIGWDVSNTSISIDPGSASRSMVLEQGDFYVKNDGVSYLTGGLQTGLSGSLDNGPYYILSVEGTFLRDGGTQTATVTFDSATQSELNGKTVKQLMVNLDEDAGGQSAVVTSGAQSTATYGFYANCLRTSPTSIVLNELGVQYSTTVNNYMYAIIIYQD